MPIEAAAAAAAQAAGSKQVAATWQMPANTNDMLYEKREKHHSITRRQ
jgi:hypothetical protein